MNSIFIYSMIFSIFAVYFIGNVSRILRNIFMVVILIYSGLFFMQNGGLNFEMRLLSEGLFELGFASNGAGNYICILNHLVFFVLLMRDIAKEKHESESSYFMNILFVFFLTNLLLFSRNLLTAIIIYELLMYFMMFLIAANVNQRKTVNDLLFINSILSSMFMIALVIVLYSIKAGVVLQYSLLILVMAGRLFMIPFNTRFFNSLKKMSILMLGYFLFVLFVINASLYYLITDISAGECRRVFDYGYPLFALFMIFSFFKALSSSDLKQMIFFSMTMAVSMLSSHIFMMGSRYADAMPVIFGTLISFSVLFAETDLIEDKFKTTDLRKLSGIGFYIPHAPFIFLMSFLILMSVPPSIGSCCSAFIMNYSIGFKVLYSVYLISFSIISFKIAALLFFSSSQYSGISVLEYKKNSEKIYVNLILLLSLAIVLFGLASRNMQHILTYDYLLGKMSVSVPVNSEINLFMNIIAFLYILISNNIGSKKSGTEHIGNNEKSKEIIYSRSDSLHSFEKNMNMNGLNFYGYDESKMNNALKHIDFDNGVQFVIRTIEDLGGFAVRLYQRSLSAVFLIIVLFALITFFAFNRGGL